MFDQILGAATSLVSAVIITAASVPAQPPTPPKPLELVRLERFLELKKSPMPAEQLYQYPNWKMMLAVALAESGYCQHTAGDNNCWGIKDFRRGSKNFGGYRDFESWEEAYQYTSELLFKYDPEDGMPDPHRMAKRWKFIEPLGGWISTVAYSLHDIERNTNEELATSIDPALI